MVKAFSHHKKVGTYLLGRPLGEGSFAKVKEGLHLTTGQKVAVKVIDKKRAKTDRYVRKNLRREGRLLQQIRHQHVIQLLEVMETEHCYYLVTEFCAGGNLMDYITKRRRLDEKESKKFIRQIVSAVDYLHRLGIIHRDLKVENLLLDENRNIKLIDFGLSNTIKVSPTPGGVLHGQEYLVTQCGSPAYAAPELLNHQKYGLPVDVWSIGVNMYAMLTGSLPFTVDPFNIRTLYKKMVSGQMNPLPPGLTPDAKDLLHKFLRADPQQRVTITEALRHPWVAEGRNKPMQRAPFPNKLKSNDLSTDILKHMSDTLDFRLGDVIRFVVGNIPSNACATYHLYHRKLQRHLAARDIQGRACGDSLSGTTSLAVEETTTSRFSASDRRTAQPQCDGNTQKEAVTFADPPLLQGRRNSQENLQAKTTAATQSTLDKTLSRGKERICLFSIGDKNGEPHVNAKENQDNARQGQTHPCPKFTQCSTPTATSTALSSRHVNPVIGSSLKLSHLHPATGTRKPSKTIPQTAGGTQPASILPASLLSSEFSGYTKRERTLLPLNRPPVLSAAEVQGDASELDVTVDTECKTKQGQGRRKGSLVLRATHPKASFSSRRSLTDKEFMSQQGLQKRFKNERQTKTSVATIDFADEVVTVTSLRTEDDSFTKRPMSPQALPTIRHGFNKRLRNETLGSPLEKRGTHQDIQKVDIEQRQNSNHRKTSVHDEVTDGFPVSQSIVSSPTRDLRILPVISNGATPRQ
ncbi:uncharacterized protein LOC143283402 [Babylonia areolata]|uniref:uncharacterized protein LOC143283402 n=1 Tax=Babylonia areolata TaxID=304850 RepID=UPI003FD63A5B